MSEKYPITPEGFRKVNEELNRMKSVDRPTIIREIEVARAHGDLSENAEYQYAKEKQGLIETRIRDLEARVAGAQIIDVSKIKSDRVVFGATVTILDVDADKEFTYRIVGEDEADISKGWISISSPIARGLISKQEGDEAKIQTPGGVRTFEVSKIEYK